MRMKKRMLGHVGLSLIKGNTYSRGSDGTTGRRTVPVSSRVTEAFTDSHSPIAESSQGREHIVSEVVCGLRVDIMTNGEPIAGGSSGTTFSDVSTEPVLRFLDLGGVVLVVVVGINVEVCNVVSKGSHVSFATRHSSAARVRRAHVGWEVSNDVANCHLVLDHLILTISGGDGTQVQMSPGVGCDLVTFGCHSLDGGLVACSCIDLSLVDVVASNEEGRLCVVRLEEVQDMIGIIGEWAVIVRDSDCATSDTIGDSSATVYDCSELGAGHSACVCSCRCNVLRASGTVLVVATRGVAIVGSVSAP
jgi:hypothetical protein